MSDSWWAKKLGGQPAPRQQPGTPPVPQAVPPHQRPMAPIPQQYAPQGQVQQPQQYTDEVLPEGTPTDVLVAHNAERLRTREYAEIPVEAKALRRSGGVCPECGSGNFFTGGTPGREHQHCYDCGYPLVQAGSGMGALGGTGIIAKGGTHAARSPVYSDPGSVGFG